MKQIGLFCGTFNPIHMGHLLIAECARDQFNLDKVLFVTSPNPPHRQKGLLDAKDRHELVQAAVVGNPYFEASKLELGRSGPSYTIDTVKQAQKLFGAQVEINLLIGGDNLALIPTWHQADELVLAVRLLVAPRLHLLERKNRLVESQIEPLCQYEAPPQFENGVLKKAKLAIVDFPGVAISSSFIRKQAQEGRSVLYMVPISVNKIMIEKGHYRKPYGNK